MTERLARIGLKGVLEQHPLLAEIFDAVAIVLSEKGCLALLKEAAAVQFVMDAFGHLKAIGATKAARRLLDRAGVEADELRDRLSTQGSVVSARGRDLDPSPTSRPLSLPGHRATRSSRCSCLP